MRISLHSFVSACTDVTTLLGAYVRHTLQIYAPGPIANISEQVFAPSESGRPTVLQTFARGFTSGLFGFDASG